MISIKEVTKTVPNDLFNEILVIDHNNQNIKKFLEEISILLFRYFKSDSVGIKVTSGVSYFFNTSKVDFTILNKIEGKDTFPSIKFGRNTSSGREIVRLIQDDYYSEAFLCIAVRDKLLTNRVYGIVLLQVESNITEEDYEKAIKLSHALSALISELFSSKHNL